MPGQEGPKARVASKKGSINPLPGSLTNRFYTASSIEKIKETLDIQETS